MPYSTKWITAAALAGLTLAATSFSAGAQSSDEQETVTEQEAAPADNGLAMGEEVNTERQPGQTYIKEQFDDWALRCIVQPDADDPCQMYQLLSDQTNSPIAEFTMFRLPEGGQAAAGATIIVPLETSLQDQLSIQVDSQPAKRYPFAFCNTVGCFARIGLTTEDVNAYKRGAEATLSIVPIAAPDQVVAVKMSLGGFTAAFEQVSVLDQP